MRCFSLLQSSMEEDSEEEEDAPVLMICEATHTYKGRYEDELSFTAGDQIFVTADSEWVFVKSDATSDHNCECYNNIFIKLSCDFINYSSVIKYWDDNMPQNCFMFPELSNHKHINKSGNSYIRNEVFSDTLCYRICKIFISSLQTLPLL